MNGTLNKIVTGSLLALTLLFPIKISSAQDNGCQETISNYKKSLRGGLWGFRGNGSLDRFKPKNQNKSYYGDDLANIVDFLGDYDQETCDTNHALYRDSIGALLDNLYTENDFSRSAIRDTLGNESVLNFYEQMQGLQDLAEDVQAQALQVQQDFPDLNLAKRKTLPAQLEDWQDYLQELADYSTFLTNQALLLRELPPGSEQTITEEEIKEGEKIARETYGHLQDLQASMGKENWSENWDNFKNWKRGQKDSFDNLLGIQQQALDNAEYLVAIVSWQRVTYQTSEGETESCYVNQTFAREWGNNGENFYDITRKIEEIRREIDEIDLTQSPNTQTVLPPNSNQVPCADSLLYGKQFWDISGCSEGWHMRKDCKIANIDEGSNYQIIEDSSYDGLTMTLGAEDDNTVYEFYNTLRKADDPSLQNILRGFGAYYVVDVFGKECYPLSHESNCMLFAESDTQFTGWRECKRIVKERMQEIDQ